jgi:hypothetical protein
MAKAELTNIAPLSGRCEAAMMSSPGVSVFVEL